MVRVCRERIRSHTVREMNRREEEEERPKDLQHITFILWLEVIQHQFHHFYRESITPFIIS